MTLRRVDPLPGAGEGSPAVFVHGLLVNADLSRSVVPGVKVAASGIDSYGPFSATKNRARLR